MELTLAQLAGKIGSGEISKDTLILPWETADQVVGWLYREPVNAEHTGIGIGEYADAGRYEVLPAETASALEAWRNGGPSPFENEMLCLSVWSASHIIWKAEQDYLSGGA